MSRFLFLIAFLWALPAQADDKSVVQQRLLAFVSQFSDTAFGSAVSLVQPNAVIAGLANSLDVGVNPGLASPGKFYPPNARAFGGLGPVSFRNSLLEVRSLQAGNAIDDLTTWHEFLHHLVRLNGGYACGPEEAYMDLNEGRVDWLSKVKRAVDVPSKGVIGYYELNKRWKLLEQEYRDKLAGDYTWRDPDASCGTAGAAYQINPFAALSLDGKLGIRVALSDVRAAYPRLTPQPPAQIGGRWCRQGREGSTQQHEVNVAQTAEGINFGAAFVDRDGTEGDLLDATTVLLKRRGSGDLAYIARGKLAGTEIRWDNGDTWKRLGQNETCANAAQVTWIGTYVAGRAKVTITADTADSVQATDFWSETDDMKPHPHRTEGRWIGCKKVKAEEIECSWQSNYTDPDKDMARSGTMKATLNGNSLRVVATEDEPKAKWRSAPYPSSMHKGKVWDTTFKRVMCSDPNQTAGC
ncbi:MAG: hypothetical protein AB7F67_27445 [Rhodospirillaceae bacterium]